MHDWDQVIAYHRQDIQKRMESGWTRVPLPDGEYKHANELSEEELHSLEPEQQRIVVELFSESAEAENGMAVLLVDSVHKLKHVDSLEESDLPALAAYMEEEEKREREFAETLDSFLLPRWEFERDMDRFEGKEPKPDETLGGRFLDERPE